MATFAITGVSRGIGFTLTKQLLEMPETVVAKVFGLLRGNPSDELREMVDRNPERLVTVKVAVDDEASVKAAADQIQTNLGQKGLDVLVNNAGMNGFAPEGIATVPEDQLAKVFNVNVIGVHRVTAAFLPLLQKGQQKKVINISTTLGAISWSHKYKLSPNPSYKISKAALNMLTVQYAQEYEKAGFTFLCVSPGWLKTEIGGGDMADFPVETGVTEVKRIILEAGPKQNGKFLNIHVPGHEDAWGKYDGKEISW